MTDPASCCLQLQGEGATGAPFKYRGMVRTVLTISREEGVLALYNGIVPGLQRQVCFCAVRIGLYETVRAFYFRTFLGKLCPVS